MKLAAIVLFVSLFAASAPQSRAQTAVVRGLLESGQTRKAPAPGITVTLQTKSYVSPAVTSGKDGLYYIPNVPPGTYTLKVWVTQKNPLTFTVTVKAPLTDIPPVIVPAGSGH